MSQDLLMQILTQKIDGDIEEIVEFLLIYKKNDYIYPSVVKNKFKFDNKKVYEILTILEENGILKMCYVVDCNNCNGRIGTFTTYGELNNLECNKCEEIISIEHSTKVVYKVEV